MLNAAKTKVRADATFVETALFLRAPLRHSQERHSLNFVTDLTP